MMKSLTPETTKEEETESTIPSNQRTSTETIKTSTTSWKARSVELPSLKQEMAKYISRSQVPISLLTHLQLYFFHAPAFLSIDPHEFDIESYTPPTKEHHKRDPPDNPAKFSSFSTASTKLHWRHSPNSDELQSNARIVRWSDGSLTLQMASNPREQYAIPAKPLSAPQINPPKRTPLSVQTTSPHDYKPTGPNPESNTYLAVGVERMGFYRNIAHFTTSLTPLPNTLNEDADNAISMLRDSLAATRRLSTITPASSSIVVSLEDPEKARRDAEYLEKEKLKLDRRNKSAQDRVATRDAKATARRYGGTGLSAHDLEREDGMPTTTKSRAGKGNPTAAARQRRRAANRRGEIYSDDDEGYGARGHTKEDEYDVDDGFLVGSDEEEEVVEESEEEDLDAEGEEETPPPTRPAAQSSSKPQLVRGSPTATRVERDRASPKRGAADDEEGAGGPARVKRRLVVEDEDDDE
jgi:RNA polymerase-associated protein LEO1